MLVFLHVKVSFSFFFIQSYGCTKNDIKLWLVTNNGL